MIDTDKRILDMTAGSRMFWWDKHNPHAVFVDKRNATYTSKDSGTATGVRRIDVHPDVVADWTKGLPFEDNKFNLVVFDPPHLIKAGENSWLSKKYGVLGGHWQEDIVKGFDEAMRVLKPYGTLIFKWNDEQIKLSSLLALTKYKPLFGDKRSKTHWLTFMKGVS